MPSKAKRAQITRRDRRKAKESNWAREGRSNPKKVGHGGGGQLTTGKAGLKLEAVTPKVKKPKMEQQTFNYALVYKLSSGECATNLGEQLKKVLDGSQ